MEEKVTAYNVRMNELKASMRASDTFFYVIITLAAIAIMISLLLP